MEFKGTKGKWELSDDKRNIRVLVKPQTYKTICSNFYNTKWQYDAKLIAAAPEMFEMLKELLQDIDELTIPTSMNNTIFRAEQLLTQITK